jgi:hypothetical protein
MNPDTYLIRMFNRHVDLNQNQYLITIFHKTMILASISYLHALVCNHSDSDPNFVTLQHNISNLKTRDAIHSNVDRFPCRFYVGKKLPALSNIKTRLKL